MDQFQKLQWSGKLIQERPEEQANSQELKEKLMLLNLIPLPSGTKIEAKLSLQNFAGKILI